MGRPKEGPRSSSQAPKISVAKPKRVGAECMELELNKTKQKRELIHSSFQKLQGAGDGNESEAPTLTNLAGKGNDETEKRKNLIALIKAQLQRKQRLLLPPAVLPQRTVRITSPLRVLIALPNDKTGRTTERQRCATTHIVSSRCAQRRPGTTRSRTESVQSNGRQMPETMSVCVRTGVRSRPTRPQSATTYSHLRQRTQQRPTVISVIQAATSHRRDQMLQELPELRQKLVETARTCRTDAIFPWALTLHRPRTQQEHKNILSKLIAFAGKTEFTPRDVLDYAYERHYAPRRRMMNGEKEVKWATTRRLLGAAIGAKRIASIYQMGNNLDLMEDIEFAMSARYVEKQVVRQPVDFPEAAVLPDLEKAFKEKSTTDPECATFLALAWACTSRLGCLAQFSVRSIQQIPATPTTPGAFLFLRGKTVEMGNQPYTLHPCLGQFHGVATKWLKQAHSRPPEQDLFRPDILAAATKALKQQNPRLEARSIRRGALQAMADKGVTDEDLLLFSRHKNIEMLHRYLAWGSHGLDRATREAAASLKIIGTVASQK